MTTKIIALWLIATAILGLLVWNRWSVVQQNRNYLASHPMPQNRRLEEHDLSAPKIRGIGFYLPQREKLIGKYLQHVVGLNAAIQITDVADHPVIRAIDCASLKASDCPRWVFVETSEPSTINAGSIVDVRGKSGIIQRKRVAAVVLSEKKWYAIIMMTEAERMVAGDAPKVETRSAWSESMQELKWKKVGEAVKVPAKPNGIWTVALPWVPAGTLLKFESDGTWHYSDQSTSGPDGDAKATGTLCDTAAVGAVIGKLGGSSAGTKDGTIFAVGKFTIYNSGQNSGPLYLTINVDPAKFPANQDVITVTISEITL